MTPLPVTQLPFIGPDLGTFRDGKHTSTFSVTEQNKICEDILNALVYLKHQKIVHRDIKPKNILWSRQHRRATLIDFGMACKADECNSDAGFGTPCFIAPEVALGITRSFAADMWAMGIVLLFVQGHIATTDLKPWRLNHDAANGFKSHWNWVRQVENWKGLLPRGSVIQKMLEHDPKQRMRADRVELKMPIAQSTYGSSMF